MDNVWSVPSLKILGQIDYLKLDGSSSIRNFEIIRRAINLKSLDIIKCRNSFDVIFLYKCYMENLVTLKIRYCDDKLVSLIPKKFPNLQTLEIKYHSKKEEINLWKLT